MFKNILLEAEQKELITIFVEAARNVQLAERQKFMSVEGYTYAEICHSGLPNRILKVYKGDVEILANKGLINPSQIEHDIMYFDVTPEGFQYYEEMKKQMGEPVQKIEQSIKSFFATDDFQRKYSTAYQKWLQAEALLWASESESQFTTIGHICREALQEFASALVTQYGLPNDEKDKASTVARMKAVINIRSDKLGKTEKAFLEALLAYWGTMSDLIQRQEHGGQKEGDPLIWEDGRRVVFQTAILMFEVDKSLSRNP